jgi:hypothetical protein
MMDLKKLIAKKKASGEELSPAERMAKSSVLSHLMDDMDGMGADKVMGLKKVTVAAPDKKGLEEGLKKASDLVDKGPLHSEDEDEVSHQGDDGNEDEPRDQEQDEQDSEEEEAVPADQEKSPHEMDEHELQDHIEKLKKLHESKKSHYGM